MDPRRETELWPHEGNEIYRAYDRILDCRRHGWANVQATHLNLPFAGEDELARLLAAVRLVLPLLPALAASSPVLEGRTTDLLDNRLSFYRTNSARVPEMTGIVIPEPVYDAATYRRTVLAPIDARLAPLDTDGILVGHEWLNARGAIVRFDRDAIEVRLLDTQECPRADLGLCAAVVGVLRALVAERWSSLAAQRAHASEPLAALLERAVAKGPAASLEDPAYAAHFGSRATTAGGLWQELVAATFDGPPELAEPVGLVLSHGTLAQRIQRALGREPSRERLRAVYLELCGCLSDGALFDAP
jgi:gamma-glutamyl:cysteine ligase YbdK (ATP-grasp superfamily)